ncbi:MAG: amidohydrolase family protein, partial [Paracoccaceae bacterium]|nr:amidohydrolase family protein [Paracoccaceae bacterium]
MGRIDAHCHFWNPARRDYGWLDRAGPTLQRVFAPSDLAALNGAAQVVAVQAAPTEAETDYLLGLDHPMIAGVVGWVDMTDPQAVARLETRAANPAFKGIRPMLQDIADTDWIVTAPRRDIL